MVTVSIHQTIHGYRDGHRLLSGSNPLNADAARAMLVLSDMSGPSMQPGFDEYLTGYPLPSSDFFVLAKTWYAPEMQRPGCVWTHSLLIPRPQVSSVTTARLLEFFRRPQLDGVETAAATPITLGDETNGFTARGKFADRDLAAALVGAVLGQPRPVIVAVDTAVQLEALILRLWVELWPAERARFSFCTGALMPRSNAGVLLDLQAVPRSIPSAQFRKSASAALILDLRAPNKPAAWVDLILDGATHGNAAFQAWVEAAAGPDAGRASVPILVPIFSDWYAPNTSARSVLASIMGTKDLDPSSQSRLIGMAFDRAGKETGATGRRELLQDLCAHQYAELISDAPMFETQACKLFEESRAEGTTLVISLLGGDLTALGERLLRVVVVLLEPNDVEMFGDSQAQFLPTIVGANPRLASSPVLWKRVGHRGGDVLTQLGSKNLNDEERVAVVDAILTAGCDVSVDALVRFGGKIAICRGLSALTAGHIPLSWQWRSALSALPDAVLEWIEGMSKPSVRELEFGSRFLSPQFTQARLVKVWTSGTYEAGPLVARVSAFGLALAFWEGNARSSLFTACFQPTYDAAEHSRLEYDEWEWLREHAPSMSWYRDWDRCKRLAAAMARLFEKQNASLETVFGAMRNYSAIKQFTAILDDSRDTRPYLDTLRQTAKKSPIGVREQREALLEDR